MLRLLLTGGGTLGSVTPLLALHDVLHPDAVFWIGTKHGVEEELVRAAAIPYSSIVSGKFRRYWDVRTLAAPFEVTVGFIQALVLLLRLRPTHVIGAGGYVAVPVIWAAWLLRIPSYTVQLDVHPGLANRLIAPFVHKIFLTFEASARYFPKQKVLVTGAPVRVSGVRRQVSGADPLLLVTGGGTGSEALNALVVAAVPALTKLCTIMHVTGKNKAPIFHPQLLIQKYTHVAFLTDTMMQTIVDADIVVTRAGMGMLSELAALKKAAIVIPLPESPQEENARVLAGRDAIALRSQEQYTPKQFVEDVRTLLSSAQRRQELGVRLHEALPTDGAEKIASYLTNELRN